jgi:MFS family permease
MKNKLPFKDKGLWAIISEGFISRLGFGIVSFALPLYAEQLGMSIAAIGVLVSIDVIFTIAFKPLMGWICDHFGLKRTYLAAIAVRSTVPILMAFAIAPWQLFATRVIYGLAIAMRDPSLNALLVHRGANKKTIATGFAWYETLKGVAGNIGGAAAGLLIGLTLSNYRAIFLGAFAIALIPLAIIQFYVEEVRSKEYALAARGIQPVVDIQPQPEDGQVKADAPLTTETQPAARPAPRKGMPWKSWASVLSFMSLGVLITGNAEMLTGLLPVIAEKYAGVDPESLGIVYLLSTVFILISGPLFGWITDNVSRKLSLMCRGIANAASSIVLIVSPNLFGLVFSEVSDDIGKSAFKPGWGAMMAHVAGYDPEHPAQAMSYLSLAEDFGEAAGPIVATFIWSIWGLPVALTLRIILAVINEVFTWFKITPLEEEQAAEARANTIAAQS